ncbi:unnamed protein product [Effrenium voratum]|uniref:protein-serine/threonine phosphatase n=1 Tax=Effrenium voratum TaxID=2562239 RepID=A0AA36JJM8_9DINO|nr:unnamed protein product [Effrenium voratum]
MANLQDNVEFFHAFMAEAHNICEREEAAKRGAFPPESQRRHKRLRPTPDFIDWTSPDGPAIEDLDLSDNVIFFHAFFREVRRICEKEEQMEAAERREAERRAEKIEAERRRSPEPAKPGQRRRNGKRSRKAERSAPHLERAEPLRPPVQTGADIFNSGKDVQPCALGPVAQPSPSSADAKEPAEAAQAVGGKGKAPGLVVFSKAKCRRPTPSIGLGEHSSESQNLEEAAQKRQEREEAKAELVQVVAQQEKSQAQIDRLQRAIERASAAGLESEFIEIGRQSVCNIWDALADAEAARKQKEAQQLKLEEEAQKRQMEKDQEKSQTQIDRLKRAIEYATAAGLESDLIEVANQRVSDIWSALADVEEERKQKAMAEARKRMEKEQAKTWLEEVLAEEEKSQTRIGRLNHALERAAAVGLESELIDTAQQKVCDIWSALADEEEERKQKEAQQALASQEPELKGEAPASAAVQSLPGSMEGSLPSSPVGEPEPSIHETRHQPETPKPEQPEPSPASSTASSTNSAKLKTDIPEVVLVEDGDEVEIQPLRQPALRKMKSDVLERPHCLNSDVSEKPHLVLDIDHVLVNAMPASRCRMEPVSEDVVQWQEADLHFIKLRPFVLSFLKSMQCIFHLYLCSLGSRPYVERVRQALESQGQLFRDIRSKESFERASQKDLNNWGLPLHRTVIVDDRHDVWNSYGDFLKRSGQVSPAFILASKYTFLEDAYGPPLDDTDRFLPTLGRHLQQLHHTMGNRHSARTVMPQLRKEFLSSLRILIHPPLDGLKRDAESLGAKIVVTKSSAELDDVHVMLVSGPNSKNSLITMAREKNIPVVGREWLAFCGHSCALRHPQPFEWGQNTNSRAAIARAWNTPEGLIVLQQLENLCASRKITVGGH